MGLDIQLTVDNEAQILTPAYLSSEVVVFNKHSLSRTFCNLMCRKNVVDGETELEQIGRITKVDISPIKDMEKYWDESDIEDHLSLIENENERQDFLQSINDDKTAITNNISKVDKTITELIEKLLLIDNLHDLLFDNGFDNLDNQTYFADFKTDKGDGYIGNNFGQDLRNFKRFIDYVKENASETIFFRYG